MLNNKSILITGGTGSFGKKFTETILKRYPDVKRLVIYSRDELKQFDMSQLYPHDKYPQVRFFIGDVRDYSRFKRACQGIDVIIHAAALKQVLKTNIMGAQNVINAAMECGIKKVVALSTDKAASPINLYGATKLCSDKLFISANNIRGMRDITYSVVRYGNVMGSRGSVIPFFLDKRKEGVLPITNPEMTRFNISLEEGVELVLLALERSMGGEIFVPKIPSYKITDVAEAIGPECEHPVIGIRPGEKIHEEMITEHDSFSTIDAGEYFVLLPVLTDDKMQKYLDHYKATKVPMGFKYNSGTNSQWLSVEDIRNLIKGHVDPDFSI